MTCRSEMTECTGDPSVITMHDVQKLIAKKDELEAQIKAFYEVLEDQKSIGMDGPLVDIEGYPRTDVDLYQIRTARHNIVCLQNDHKAIMKDIEEALHNLHARDKEKRVKDEVEAQAEALQHNLDLLVPFAKVDAVTPGSPASMSGLQVGDEITAFGSVNSKNFQNLQNIATVVQHSEGAMAVIVEFQQEAELPVGDPKRGGTGLLCANQCTEERPLSVTVIRDGKSVHLGLTPQRWSGKGLLGCNIIPIKR